MWFVFRASASVLILLMFVHPVAATVDDPEFRLFTIPSGLPGDGGLPFPGVPSTPTLASTQAAVYTVANELFPENLQPLLPQSSDDAFQAPWGLAGAPFGDGVQLVWQAPLQETPEGYRVYRAVDDGDPVPLADVEDMGYMDRTAWDHNATVLTYTVTALYGPDSPAKESQSSNAAWLPGAFGSCRLLWVYPHSQTFPPDIDYDINQRYLECLGHLDVNTGA